MLQSIQGVYKNGLIELTEKPDNIDESLVIVTFLEVKNDRATKSIIRYGMFADLKQSTEEDFKVAEFSIDVDDRLDWS